ncbi:uncharacterized protein LOC126552989 [Aphis gossypii]|uniref:uncharacterized protein LOC126552989 n=1 Tax=Aphis gossypii TaxID=80765 RepID=UPI002159A009|nr:uncharacterized protein LOC126552989 [Aphis gossypii]
MKSRGNNKKGKLAQHFSSASHKLAMLDYCAFISQSSRVDFMFNKSARRLAIRQKSEQEFNRQAVGMLVNVVRTLVRQVLLLYRHNPIIERWLNDKSMRPYHVTYLGSKSQNEFIELLAAENLMADTTPDISLKDQLAVCLRYVDQNGITNERLLDVVESTDKTGYGTAKSIYDCLIKYEINTDNLAFQSYDYASNISGINRRAQRFLTEFVGHSVTYIPCQAHRMNTFLEHSCDASPIIGDLISVLENIYVFFSSSTKRSKDLTDQQLEAKELNICDAYVLINSTIKSLENIRSDTKNIDSLIESSKITSESFGIDPERDFKRHHHTRKIPKRIENNADNSTVENLTKAFYLFPPKSQGGQLTDLDAVIAEWEILCHQCKNFETFKQVMEKSIELQKPLPWANWLCRLAFTAPVTTASNERTFSKLKLIKHSLSSTISSDRLSSLMILNCEKDLTDKIDINCVLQKWSSAKQRRIEI